MLSRRPNVPAKRAGFLAYHAASSTFTAPLFGCRWPGLAVLPLGTKRTFVPDPTGKGQDAVLYVEGPRADIACIYISGRRNRSAEMMRGHHFRINLMPWIRWDEPNEIELEASYRGPHDVMDVTHLEVRYYQPD